MSDDYLEAKRLHAEAQRLRDEAAELNATLIENCVTGTMRSAKPGIGWIL